MVSWKWKMLDLNWRSSLKIGLTCSIAITLANIGLLLMILIRGNEGSTIYTGSCATMSDLSTGIDVLVNIASTLILGASSLAVQCLSAPTREELDKAHAHGVSLQIGVSSVKNWIAAPRWRQVLTVAIILSSLPLHLIFNSVFISRSYATGFLAAVVDQRFVDGGPWVNASHGNWVFTEYNDTNKDLIDVLQENAVTNNLEELQASECYKTFSADIVQTYNGVLLVVDHLDNATGPLHDYTTTNPMMQFDDHHNWICNLALPACDMKQLRSNWTVADMDNQGNRTIQVPVSRCLAQRAQQECEIDVFPGFLLAVILGTTSGIISIGYLLRQGQFLPLITTGDAIASFLTQPSTRLQVNPETNEPSSKGDSDPPSFRATRNRLWAGASRQRRFLTTVFCSIYIWVGVLGILVAGYNSGGLGSLLGEVRLGPFSTSPETYIESSRERSIDINAILVNVPQLLLSAVYLAYNALWTCMCAEQEYASYALHRKGLRVSNPKGQQRSTYWLSLPWKFGAPLLAASAFLHWMMSQTLSLAEVVAADADPWVVREDEQVNCLRWSVAGQIILICTGILLTALPFAYGAFRGKSLMPVIRGNSLEIARACANGIGDDAQEKIKFGVLDEDKTIGFSSGEVGQLQEGDEYEK